MSRLKSILFLSIFLLACTFGASAQDPTATVTDGGMSLLFITSSWTNAGITIYNAYYNTSGSGYQGFEATGGDLDLTTGYGTIQTTGSVHFSMGSLTLDLKHFYYSYAGNTPVITAAIYENGVLEGRQEIFTIYNGNTFALPMSPGAVMSAKNNKMLFTNAFVSTFTKFFSTPQLVAVMSPGGNGAYAAFSAFSLKLVADTSSAKTAK